MVRKRVSSPQGNYEATVHNIRDLVLEVESKAGGTGSVGVAIPGTISPASGLIKNANSTWLAGKALDKDLGTVLNRPVRLANDANCFALSESVDGAAEGYNTVFGVILGTRVGGGLVLNNGLHKGRNQIAGEWGHNTLHQDGPRCWCGSFGCVETFISGPAIVSQWPGKSSPENAESLTTWQTMVTVKRSPSLIHYSVIWH